MKIQIDTPSSFSFTTSILIRIDDINYGNHLANDKLLAYAHECRVRFLNSLGYTELDIEGTGIILTESAVQYKSEGFHGQELEVQLAVNKASDLVLDFTYIFTEKNSKKEIARAYTKIVSYNYDKKKVSRFHSLFLNKLS